MPDGGWEPVEPWRVGTKSGPAPLGGSTTGSGGRLARSPRGRLLVGALGLVVVIGVAWSVVGPGSDGGEGEGGGAGADDEALSEVRERTDDERASADDRDDDARRAFAEASRSLEIGGSYTYHGTVHAPAAGEARPAHEPAPDVTVDGEVLWPQRTHDIAVDAAGRAAETVTVGPSIWQRLAPSREGLQTETYEFVGDVPTWDSPVVPFGAGAARVPGWLTATTDRVHRSDVSGRRTFVARLPADRLGDTGSDGPPVDGEVVLTVDTDGDPLRIEVAVASEAATGSAWRLSYDISAIGDTVTIDIPNGELPSVTEGPSPGDVRAAGIAAPVELGQLPEGWLLGDISLERSGERLECPHLQLAYGGSDLREVLDGAPEWLTLDVLPPTCTRPLDPPGAREVLESGPFIGGSATFPEGQGGVLSDGHTALQYTSSLPTADVLRLLATLEPYDPPTRPPPPPPDPCPRAPGPATRPEVEDSPSVAEGEWAPIDAPAPAPPPGRSAPPPPPLLPGPPLPPPPRPPVRVGHGQRRWVLFGGIAAVAVVLAVVLGAALTSDDDTGGPAASDPADVGDAEGYGAAGQPEGEGLNPSQAFATALRQIEQGGSFHYWGTTHADEATALRPTSVLDGWIAVDGEVGLPHRVHELASDGGDQVFETTIVGPGAWERAIPVEGGPAAAAPYGPGQRGTMEMSAALLPAWLGAATDRAAVEPADPLTLPDPDARLFSGTLVLAELAGPTRIVITLDADDVLTHVDIGRRGDAFSVDWNISGIGDRVDIPTPGEELVDAAVDVDGDDVAAAGIDAPVQLTEVPAGWVLADAWVEPDAPRGGCSTLNLDYLPIDVPDDAGLVLELDVMAASCGPTEPLGPPFAVGHRSGEAQDSDDPSWPGFTVGRVSDGTTLVKFTSTLGLDDVAVVLGSLAPFDPALQPTEVDGLG